MRALGIDFGERHIGVAVSDQLKVTSRGVTVIDTSGDIPFDVKKIKEVLSQFPDVDEIVVGLPKTLRGEVGHEAKIVLKFVDALRSEVSVPIVTWDERYSTKAVERVLIEADVSRKKRKKIIDKSAAVYILQGYLDSKAMRAEGES